VVAEDAGSLPLSGNLGGKLYLASEEGHVFAVKMGPTFELLATNVLEDASFIATPAIVDGTMLLRSRTGLYKIGGTRDTKLDRDVALKVLP
jgi:hypothetical protein